MISKALWALALPASVTLGGCVKTVDIDDGRSFVLKADERVILTKDNPTKSRTVALGDPVPEEVGSNNDRLVCSEPSPDAITALALNSSVSGGNGEIGAQIATGLAQHSAAISVRTAPIEILRDLGFRACEGVMNGVVGIPAYRRIIGGIPATTLGLVAIDGLTQRPTAQGATAEATAPQANTSAPGSLTRNAGGDGAPQLPITRTSTTQGSAGAPLSSSEAANRAGSSARDRVLTGAPTPGVDVASPVSNSVAGAVVQVVCLTTVAAPALAKPATPQPTDGAAAQEAQAIDVINACAGSATGLAGAGRR